MKSPLPEGLPAGWSALPLILGLALSSAPARAQAPGPAGAGEKGRKRYDHGDPTAQEQLMLELVNRARADPEAEAQRLGLGLNEGLGLGRISKNAKAPLAFHPALIAAARAHTRWMLESGQFSHTGQGGSSAGKRMGNAGYQFTGTWTQAENISFGGVAGALDLEAETKARQESLFRSPGHRKNICDPDSRNVGIGILSGPFKGSKAVLATQTFASSEAYAAPLLLGVVFSDRDGDGFYDPGEGLSGVRVRPAGGEWEAVTSSSGGYAVPCPLSAAGGKIRVIFSGDGIRKEEEREVRATGGNVKLDLIRR